MSDEQKFEGRMHGPQEDPERRDTIWMRLLYMVLIAAMLSMAYSVLGVVTVVQFVMMLINREPNKQLADFGESLGIWMAKAARFQTAASEVKPWPWTELD
ncbi:hypothetical protein AIOL_003112 [Candidatus Rhodobacter oscarellae]|uniref:Lipase n=1 Tax=Candidatus Rhodobacter oscarellae TaxID=1675527 RepID=A0A0J9E664_9RHOB|nr:DUF4389 domain-containing protein [Candidatus Rhodobacter lobularis]KMW58141.1 hypothetical protein AIOL_003112 [Candidatus Rhodobacter lobularis]